ncbi:hypothetical protein ACIPCF_07895 [Paracoccus marcusii]|uniref:hypothetical protein n=1 Tax=Paracoccus marcusii TaxID=59779 RepID=UPI0038BDD148
MPREVPIGWSSGSTLLENWLRELAEKQQEAGLRKNNLDATRAPLASDDATAGYEIGSRWFHDRQEWHASRVSAGQAVWVLVGGDAVAAAGAADRKAEAAAQAAGVADGKAVEAMEVASGLAGRLGGDNLPAIAALPASADTLAYFAGPGTARLTPISMIGRDILAQPTPQDMRQALGLTGYAGAGIRIRGVLANTAALPATGNTVGDAFMIGTNLYVWNGAAPWVNAGAVAGPAGADGMQIYSSRAAAAIAAPNLPSGVTFLMNRNGNSAIELRQRNVTTGEPLFPSGDRWGVIQTHSTDAAFPAVTDVAGTANAITATFPLGFTNGPGVRFSLVPVAANTGTVTLNGLSLRDMDGVPLVANALTPQRTYLFERMRTVNAYQMVAEPISRADISILVQGATASIAEQVATRAPIASPAFTGAPTAPTASVDSESQQIATTAFVKSAITAASGAAIPANAMLLIGPGDIVPDGWQVAHTLDLGGIEFRTIQQERLMMLAAPEASATTIQIDETLSFTLGEWSGAETVVGTLTQNGIDRTSEVTDGVWNPGRTGSWVWTVTATSASGDTLVRTVSGAVVAELTIEGLSYFYLDGTAAYTQTPEAGVTAVTAGGTGALAMTVAGVGSPNLISHAGTGDDGGLRFSVGRYLAVTGIDPSTAAGAIVLLDMTVDTVTGTAQGIVVGGTQAVLRRGGASYATVAATTGASGINSGTATAGQRVTMAVEIDAVGGVTRYRRTDTGAVVDVAGSPVVFSATSITIGQGMAGIVHRAALILRPAGTDFPLPFQQILSMFASAGSNPGDGDGGESGSDIPVTPTVLGFDSIEQSLGLGPNVGNSAAPDGRLWRDVMGGGNDVVMLDGLIRSDERDISSVAAPLLQGYNLDADPTGIKPAYASGNIPGGLIMAKSLKRDGIITDLMSYHFNGAGGQPIANFDNDPTDGSLNTLLYDNSQHVISKSAAYYATRQAVFQVLWFLLNQGETDQSLPRGGYFAGATKAIDERFAMIRAHTGQAENPLLVMFQTGGYARKQNDHWMVLDQIDLLRHYGGLLVGPNWQVPVSDKNVHPGIVKHIYMYELAVWALREWLAGRQWNLLPPVSVPRVGSTITIPMSTRNDEQLTTQPGKYANYGGDPVNLGLEVMGGGAIDNAAVSGANIVLNVSGEVTEVRHAHQRAAGINYGLMTDSDGLAYVAHRSLIRTTLTRDVNSWGGTSHQLQRWVPSFSVVVT